MAASYKRIAQLLEKWPIDKTKTGRDLGEHLLKHYQTLLSSNQSDPNLEQSDRNYLAVKRLIDNEHMKKHPHTLGCSSTGLTAEQCNQALSQEFLELLQQEEQPIYKRIFGKLISNK